jgi:hypothetical protein
VIWFGKSKEEQESQTARKTENDDQRKSKDVNNKEGMKNYGRLRNILKRATEKAKKEYLER